MDIRKLLTFALAGLLAQLIDGALGMAYGVTATTVLVAGGTSAAVASASVHLAEVGTTLASGISHWRFGNVDWRMVVLLGVPGATGAFLGANVLSNLDASAMKPVVGGLLLLLGLYVLARFAFGVQRKPVPSSHLKARFLSPLGAFAGFIDAIGGGGWGPVTTPSLLTFGRQEPRRAIGSVSAAEFLVAVAASAGFLTSLGQEAVDPWVVGALLVGGVCAAPLAAVAVKKLPARVSGTFVGALIVVLNARTLMLAGEVAGPVRLVTLVALGAGGAVLVVRSWGLARDEEPFLETAEALAHEHQGPEAHTVGPVESAKPVEPALP